jgi:cAMP-binding proteins - catabolite gene activator and regulatory subunit of cAMP-dependent protein kinases
MRIPHLADQIHIELATSKKEKEKVYRLRYQIYVKEMSRRLSHADHKRQLLQDDMDDWGLLFYARSGREVIGTVRLHIGYKEDFSPELVESMAMDKFQDFQPTLGSPPPLSFASKGMVAPHYRNSKVLNMLSTEFYQACRQQGVLFNFVGCAPAIVAMHEHLGARRYKNNFFVPDYGCMVPLVNLLEDVNHLRRAHSPFWPIADAWPHSMETAAWFAREFPNASRLYINKPLTGERELWQILSSKFGQPPEEAVELFRGMREDEARVCANAGHMVYCEQAETVVYPDDMSAEIFIVVSGSLLVRRQSLGRRASVIALLPGQVYGEKNYVTHSRQNTTVIAQTDAELLVMPRHGLERLQMQHPEVAAKLLHNMGNRAMKKYA